VKLIRGFGYLLIWSAFSTWTAMTAVFNVSGNIIAGRGKSLSLNHVNHANHTSFPATVALIFMYYFFYDFAYTTMLVSYTLEILPYNIRAKGLAIMVSLLVCHLSNQ